MFLNWVNYSRLTHGLAYKNIFNVNSNLLKELKNNIMKRLTQLIILFVFAYSVSAQTPVEYIDAKDYGAKGNDEIDDSQAIQKALDAAGMNGGVCLLPAGEYRLNKELVVPEGVTLKGIGETTPHPLTPVTTVLNIYAGKGDVNAAPAITLK